MPTIFAETSVAAGGTANLFNGALYEYPKSNRGVSLGTTAAATGCFTTVQSGSDTIAEEFSPPVATVYPVIPDQFYMPFNQGVNQRLKVNVRNPTGGAVIHRAIAILTNP
jgi:hypothetical protein